MNTNTNFKDVMSQEEMAQACLEYCPFFVPNRTRVGRFARNNGYVRLKQMVNKKQVYFYVKKEIVEKYEGKI